MAITFDPSSYSAYASVPDRDAMLKAFSAINADMAAVQQDLEANPPNIADARAKLADMMSQAQAMNTEANGDMAALPAIQEMIGVIQNLQTLLNEKNPDVKGCLTLLGNNGVIHGDLSAIFQVITSDPPVPVPGQPNYADMLTQELLLGKYLEEFYEDLKKGDYNAADTIYGYVLTAASKLYTDANNDPSIAPEIAKLLGTINDMHQLFLSGDYQGCLALLKQLGI